MGADGQSRSVSNTPSHDYPFYSSIAGKLTLLVGVLLALTGGLLILVAYVATSTILRDQIHDRLSTVAEDGGEMLANEFRAQEQRTAQFARRPRIRQLLLARAGGTLDAEELRDALGAVLSAARTNTAGCLALWIEDDA